LNTENLPNTADAIIKKLLVDLREMESLNEKLRWRCKNQKREIRNLNKTVLAQKYLVLTAQSDAKEASVEKLKGLRSLVKG